MLAKARFHQSLTIFSQYCLEPLHMTWERFKIRLSREPDHELPKWYQLQVFMKGLNPTSRSWVEDRYGFLICEERPKDEAY